MTWCNQAHWHMGGNLLPAIPTTTTNRSRLKSKLLTMHLNRSLETSEDRSVCYYLCWELDINQNSKLHNAKQSSYLICYCPFAITQRLVVVVNVSHIEALSLGNLLHLIDDSIYSYKCIIITLHYILGKDLTRLKTTTMLPHDSYRQAFIRVETFSHIPHIHKWQQFSARLGHSCPCKAL